MYATRALGLGPPRPRASIVRRCSRSRVIYVPPSDHSGHPPSLFPSRVSLRNFIEMQIGTKIIDPIGWSSSFFTIALCIVAWKYKFLKSATYIFISASFRSISLYVYVNGNVSIFRNWNPFFLYALQYLTLKSKSNYDIEYVHISYAIHRSLYVNNIRAKRNTCKEGEEECRKKLTFYI